MKVQVFHLFFKTDANGVLMAADPQLYMLAVKFASEYMTTPVDFTQHKESWVACEVDEEGKPIRALGILGMVLRADFVVCRFTDNAAVVKLVQRANDFLHDAYAARGGEALVYIAKDQKPNDMCPDYLNWMKLFGMKEADRYTITVR